MGISKRALKIILIPLGIIVFISLLWTGCSIIGRVSADAPIPGSAVLRLNIHNPISLIEGILSHEPLNEIGSVPALAEIIPLIESLREEPLLKNRLVRLAAGGTVELALLSFGTGAAGAQRLEEPVFFIAAWDMRFFSPLLRIFPVFSRFLNVPNLFYVQSGGNSHFEYRLDDMTLYIGPHRNLLFITNDYSEFEGRTNQGPKGGWNIINPSSFDAVLLISPDFFVPLLAEQDPGIAAVLEHIDFNSIVEAGLRVYPNKLDLQLSSSLSSGQPALSRLLEQPSRVPNISERFPADAQYATVLSAGTLEELLETALIFSGEDLEDLIRQADSASRSILRLPLEELLFSWSGNEFAVFGIEGRPNPVYAIHIRDERRRQEVFDRAFRSIALSENVRLNLDGTRIPQIEVPYFLQSLLRRWNIFLPSPYYMVHQDYLLISESAETLLSAIRAVQRNEVLPRSAAWQEIAGVRNAASAFSLYYSLDVSMPFFLRRNTVASSFLGVYHQGLIRININRGLVDLTMTLVPGSGRGIILLDSIVIETRGPLSNQVFGAALGEQSRIFLSAADTVLSVNPNDNSIRESSGQGQHWIIPAEGLGATNVVNAWVVSDRGRISLVNGDLDPLGGFPMITGLRLSSPPAAYNGRLYLSDEDGRVHGVDPQGSVSVWETRFFTALRSPPVFLTLSGRTFAAAYPKGFFGEIWLLDSEGKALPGWPASLISEDGDDFSFDAGLGFGSPLLFALNNRVHLAFVSQAGDLFVFDENAVPFSPFPIKLDGVFFQQPVYDGEYLWLVSEEGILFRVNFEGEILLQAIAGFSVKEEGHLRVFDYDGDGVGEIFITGEGNALYAFTRNFRSLEGFPLPMWGRPHFAGGQGNSGPEIFGMGMDGRLYRWLFR